MPRIRAWPDPRVKPPYGAAEVNGAKVRGALVALLMNEGGGQPRTIGSVVTGTVGSATATDSALWPASAGGLVRTYEWFRFDQTIATMPNVNNGMTLSMIRRNVVTPSENAAHWAIEEPTGTARCLCNMPYSDGNVYFDFGGGGSPPNRLTWGGYAPTTTREVWTLVAGTTGSAIYFNGQLATSQGTAITTTVGAGKLDLNGWVINAVGGDSLEIELVTLSTAEWTASEALQFYNEPYGLFKPIVRRMWSFPTGTIVPRAAMHYARMRG
jgi:hypothetical protein